MIRSIIIDDEPYCIESLLARLQPHSSWLEVSATCTEPEQALLQIGRHQPHLLFLDIHLGRMTGFDLLEQLSDPQPRVIFTTAYDQHAIRAFRYHAIDYLLKPIEEEELARALDKLRETPVPITANPHWREVHRHYREPSMDFQKLAIPGSQGFQLIDLRELVRLEANSNYTHFFMADGKKYIVSRTLREYEDILQDAGFERIHQSHIINMRFMRSYQRGKAATVTLHDGTVLDVGNTRREAFLDKCRLWFKA